MRADHRATPRGSGRKPGALFARKIESAMHHHRAGRLGEAERIYRAILDHRPDHPQALNLLGVAACQRGEPDLAIDYIRRAIAVDRRNPQFHYNLGVAQQSAGEVDPAIASYRRAVKLKGDYADALTNLGAALVTKNEFEEAEACFRKCARLSPTDPQAHTNLGTALLARGKGDEAKACARQALRLDPDFAEAHNVLGGALLVGEDYGEAESCFRSALRRAPGYAKAHSNLGVALLGQGEPQEAMASFARAIDIQPAYAEGHHNLGNVYRDLGWPADAVREYREALRHKPDYAAAISGLGAALFDMGETEASLAHYDEVLRRDPASSAALAGKASVFEMKGDAEACYELVRPIVEAGNATPAIAATFGTISHRFGRRGDAIGLIEGMLAGTSLRNDQLRLLHSTLGELFDAEDEFDEAFHHFATASALRPTRFDPQAFADTVDRIIRFYGKHNLAALARAGNGSELPVFIVGMPRSGTSLCEQILASHPQVFGAGELTDIREITRTLAGGPGNEDAYPECTAGLSGDELSAIAEKHLAALRERGGGSIRVTDKMPYNFLRLGLIAQLFPKARVIHCIRDPLDTCLSCFFQNFQHGNFHTYDLGHLGAYYVHYLRLMAHWSEALDISVMELRYEDLVADVETVSRTLVDFVGLKWDSRCLRFYESKRVVRTASYDQVRQPIYSRSVGRWRRYERHLGPLREALGEDGG